MTVRRLSVYFRCLAQLEEDGVKTISSQELAARFHLNSAQVRKDLAYFGEFGIRGIGYDTTNLRAEIQRILGLDREWRVVLVGFGNLGSALFHYRGFARQGFRIAAIVDDDPAKVGRAVNGLAIQALAELPRVVKSQAIQIGVVAVPAEAAQGVADRLVAAGVRAILNFAPSRRQGAEGRAPPERGPVDRAGEPLLPPGAGAAVSGSSAATLATASPPSLDAWGDLARARAALGARDGADPARRPVGVRGVPRPRRAPPARAARPSWSWRTSRRRSAPSTTSAPSPGRSAGRPRARSS